MDENVLQFDNFFVFSICTVPYEGKTMLISVGVMNHVFVPDMEGVIHLIEEL